MFTIARNTIKEFVRNKILYVILTVAVFFIFFSIILSTLALREADKIIIDFSLTMIEIFWLITTIFLWSYLLYSELSKNTILLILSKSPSKYKFILWKFVWFAFVIFLIYIVLSVAFFLVLYIHWIWIDIVYFFAIILSFFKILTLLSIIILLSIFTSPFIALLVSISIYLISHSTSFIKFYLVESGRVAQWSIQHYFINSVYYIFPNFQDLSMKEHLLSPYLWSYTWMHIFFSITVAIIYIIIFLFIAVIIFNKKEF